MYLFRIYEKTAYSDNWRPIMASHYSVFETAVESEAEKRFDECVNEEYQKQRAIQEAKTNKALGIPIDCSNKTYRLVKIPMEVAKEK